MTAQPVGLQAAGLGASQWYWLTPAVEMAVAASGNCALGAAPAGAGVAAAGSARLPRVAVRTPGSDARAVRPARDFTLQILQQWGVNGRRHDVAVVVSELLANAQQHAAGRSAGQAPSPIRLGLVQPGPCVICAVADPSDLAPVPGDADDMAETGRGLRVVEALCDRWGYTAPARTGKVVWAMFATGPGASWPGGAWPGAAGAGVALAGLA
jgi:anti-sigma regulatory factor (Ser/Thr protein kinase)